MSGGSEAPSTRFGAGAGPGAAAGSGKSSRATLWLGILSVFTSAFLLFLVQPMVARMLLPGFGGSPAVWSTALVFYQAALLAGYAYAHWNATRLAPRWRTPVHLAVVLVPVLLLPPAVRAFGAPPPAVWPVPWVLAALTAAIGLPFFALASNSSLTQGWLAPALTRAGRDPYRLYAASNAGSLLALVAYPFVLEPLLGGSAQAWLWALGYVLFVALTALVMRAGRPGRSAAGAARDSLAVGANVGAAGDVGAAMSGAAVATTASEPRAWTAGDAAAEAPSAGRRSLWVVRSAVVASLLLSVTLAITTDIVAMPLLWVLPLAVYLLTFILAFALPERLPRGLLVVATAASIAVAMLLQVIPLPLSLPVQIALTLSPLAFGGLLCHLDLARDRPAPRYLTSFYLWLAVGGVVGGVLNSLLAPRLFDTVAEYPLTLAAMAWLLAAAGPGALAADLRAAWQRRNVLPALTVLLLAGVAVVGIQRSELLQRGLWVIVLVLLMPYSLLLRPRLAHFALATTTLAVLLAAGQVSLLPLVDQGRSFFGVLRVEEEAGVRVMMHGTTLHGVQQTEPALRRTPGAYYHAHGPLGSAVRALPPNAVMGLVGLGTGALAALTQPGQRATFFEIDPLVATMARRDFTYLAEAPGDVTVQIADGRLGLAAVADEAYDLLVLDAFSSDSVPAHLLTVEALDLFLRKVKPDGLIVFHISNRELDLARVFRGWSAHTGRPVAVQAWDPVRGGPGRGRGADAGGGSGAGKRHDPAPRRSLGWRVAAAAERGAGRVLDRRLVQLAGGVGQAVSLGR